MNREQTERLAPLAGVLFAVALLASFFGAGIAPDKTATGEEVIAHYDSDFDLVITLLGMGLAAISMMFFAGSLRNKMRSMGNEWLATVAFGGATIFAVGLAIFAWIQVALHDASKLGQPAVAQALNILDNNNFPIAMVGLSTLYLATAWHTMRSHALPRWLGYVTLALGICTFAGPLGVIAFLAAPFWTLVTAIVLFRDASTVDPREETTAQDTTTVP